MTDQQNHTADAVGGHRSSAMSSLGPAGTLRTVTTSWSADKVSPVHGTCDARFADVGIEFERNFKQRGELGAGVCVVHEGRTLVELWGGSKDTAGRTPWTQDTVVTVFSCTKGAVALCAHILASRGDLDLDRPVASYWPEFAQTGKRAITVRMLLNHQAGLPGVSRPLPVDAIYDFDKMVEIMAGQEPLWPPGARHGYHAMTFGWLVGEVIRRVSGTSPGTFFRENVAGPLKLDFWIGLPSSEEHRVATPAIALPVLRLWSLSPEFRAALARHEPVQVAALNSTAGFLDPGGCDAPGAHAAEIPAANGIANARALAGMYAPLSLDGQVDDVVLVDEGQVAEMASTESAGAVDAVLFEASRFTAGFEKTTHGRETALGNPGLVLSEAAFGHSGMGGSIGFADPHGRFSFGYVTNRHAGAGERNDARCQPLVDATYRSLGYRSRGGGGWI